jgi:hypothetical protein
MSLSLVLLSAMIAPIKSDAKVMSQANNNDGKTQIEQSTTPNGCYYLAGIGYRCR